MFKTGIALTPFTTDAANGFFANIVGDMFNNDNSFLATLRALVAPRMEARDSISLRFSESRYTANEVASVPADRVLNAICRGYNLGGEEVGQIIVHSFSADQESNLANLRLIEAQFMDKYKGYYRLDKIKDFYRKSFAADCYINPSYRNVVVFVDHLDYKKLHYLQVSILAFLPWYFDPKNGVSDLEMELIYSLRETTPQKYEDCLVRMAAQYDFRTARIRQLLGDFETRYERMECEKVRSEIESCDMELARLNDRVGAMLNKRNETCIRLLGLERKIADGGEDSEIMEYFLCNNRLVLENVTTRDMIFSVKDYLSYFDREMAERAINNPNSFVYSNGNSMIHGASAEKMKRLLMEIFVEEEPRLRIKSCASYRFDLNGSVGAISHHAFSYEFNDCMPNTHIDRFACMGNYSRTINQLLINRDYIGALEQCIASCKSINWGDSPVMGEFMRTMWGNSDYGYNNRCIELPDKRVVNPADAIRWLEQQDENTDGQETEEAHDEQAD